MALSLVLAASAGCSSSSTGDGHPVCIAGTWKLLSMTSGSTTVQCPGTNSTVGISCGANETLVLDPAGSFTETIAITPDSAGIWFIHRGVDSDIVVFDDNGPIDNPYAHNYVVAGNRLTTQQGTVGAVYELVSSQACNGAASVFPDRDTRLLGTWKLVSLQVGASVLTCPATDAATGITCGANETLTYSSDGRYAETLASMPDSGGIWFTNASRGDNIVVNDDSTNANNPYSYVYDIDATHLSLTSIGGYVRGSYTKQ